MNPEERNSVQLPDWWKIDPTAEFKLGPRVFPGRIWTASGCFAYGLSGHDIASTEFETPYAGIGAVVTKTVTPQPRSGNPMPRLCELPTGAINSIGLENVGYEAFLAETLARAGAARRADRRQPGRDPARGIRGDGGRPAAAAPHRTSTGTAWN